LAPVPIRDGAEERMDTMNIDIEVVAAKITKDHTIEITAIDNGQLRLDRLEENRAAEEPEEIEFRIDLQNPRQAKYARYWLHEQKAVKEAQQRAKDVFTWGMAVAAVVGTCTMISSKYRAYED
jgi:hypothetical protein